jgi:hypothetical protein
MVKRLFFIGLLAFSLIALLANEAPAILRGGTGGSGQACDCNALTALPPCVLCGKCVEGTVTATGLGNVDNTPTFVKMAVCVEIFGPPQTYHQYVKQEKRLNGLLSAGPRTNQPWDKHYRRMHLWESSRYCPKRF